MRKFCLGGWVVVLLVAVLSGCATTGGRPRGPIDGFVLTTGANPALKADVAGILNTKPTPLEVTFVVPPGTDRRSLVATLSLNSEATVTVISSGERVVQKNGVTPNDFTAPVLYSVEVPKEKKPWQYKVTVREADTNPRLAQLAFPEGYVLNPAFSPKAASYTAEVPFATRQVQVRAQAESPYLKSVTIDEKPYAGANVTGAVDFSSGQERTFTMVTIAEDGATSERYTVTLRRGAPDRNATLAAVEIADSSLAPAFSPQRREYSIRVPFAATQFVIRANPQSKFATVALNTLGESGEIQSRAPLAAKGSPADKAGATVGFAGTDWLPVFVTVTAQDESVQEYFIEVSRAEPDHNNSLSALSVTGGTLSPAFAPATLNYVVQVPFAAKQLAIGTQPQSKLAKAVVEPGPGAPADLKIQGDPATKDGAVLDFSAVDRLTLVVAVTAQDGRTSRYSLDIRRSPPDGNANLASFSVSAGLLSPPFNARTVAYTVSLPADTETVNLTLATVSRVAKVSADLPVTPSGTAYLIAVQAAAGQPIPVNVLVTAEDGSQRLYRVTVVRAAPPAGETSTRLAVLQVAGTTLSPPFSPGVLQYEAKAAANVEAVTVIARPENAAAVAAIDGQALTPAGRQYTLAPGTSLSVFIDVTLPNGTATRYTLRLTR